MTTMSFTAQPQAVPVPPNTVQQPAPTPSAPDGAGPGVAMEVEAAFLGGLLKTVLETAGPLLLGELRNRIRSMGAAAADDAAVQREYQQTGVAFLNFLVPIIGALAPTVIDLVTKAVSGQAAGGAGTASAAGSIPSQQAQSQPAQQYTR